MCRFGRFNVRYANQMHLIHVAEHKQLATATMTICAAVLLLACTVASATDLVHVPLARRAVDGNRLSHAHLALRPWAPSRAANTSLLPTHPMHGDIVTLGEYYLTLTFGGQPVNVQIDTGSSTLAVPLTECVNCRRHDHRLDLSTAKGTAGFIRCDSPACRPDTCHAFPPCTTCSKKTRACCSVVAPETCGFFLQYADTSGASGALVQADVGMAGLEVPIAFGGILRETTGFENTNVDGIFGLAYPRLACNPSCVLPLFDTLVKTGKVSRDIFSLCTARQGGTLVLGGSNPNMYHGKLEYVDMIPRKNRMFYDVAVKGVRIGDDEVKIPDFSDAIVDSGTTVLVLAPRSYVALRTHFQSKFCYVPGLCPGTSQYAKQIKQGGVRVIKVEDAQGEAGRASDGTSWFTPGYCVNLDDDHVRMLPNITVVLKGGVELTLEPELYMLKYEHRSTFAWRASVFRCLGITLLPGLEHMGNNAILGNTVLQKYFVEYDRESSRIGFAIAKNCIQSKEELSPWMAAVEQNSSPASLPHGLIVGLVVLSAAAWALVVYMCAKESNKYSGYTPIPGATSTSSAANSAS